MKDKIIPSVKDDLMAVALEFFALEGYDAVGIAKIVEACKVTKPSLYHYFGSKEGLLSSLLVGYFRPFFDELEKATDYKGDLIKTIEDVAILYFKSAVKANRVAMLIHTLRSCPIKSEAYHVSKSYYDRERQLIENMFAAIGMHHTNLQGKESVLTRSFIGLIDCNIGEDLLGMEEVSVNLLDKEESYRRLAKQFMYGIFA